MAKWNMSSRPTAHTRNDPNAVSTAADPERANHDASRDRLALAAEEIENGCVMPVWPSIKHLSCGLVQSLQHIDAARGLAQDPRRPMRTMKGFACAHPIHQRPVDEAGNESHPMFAIQGDLRGRAGEWMWVDWHGQETGILVGDNPSGRTVAHLGQTFAELAAEVFAPVAEAMQGAGVQAPLDDLSPAFVRKMAQRIVDDPKATVEQRARAAAILKEN